MSLTFCRLVIEAIGKIDGPTQQALDGHDGQRAAGKGSIDADETASQADTNLSGGPGASSSDVVVRQQDPLWHKQQQCSNGREQHRCTGGHPLEVLVVDAGPPRPGLGHG